MITGHVTKSNHIMYIVLFYSCCNSKGIACLSVVGILHCARVYHIHVHSRCARVYHIHSRCALKNTKNSWYKYPKMDQPNVKYTIWSLKCIQAMSKNLPIATPYRSPSTTVWNQSSFDNFAKSSLPQCTHNYVITTMHYADFDSWNPTNAIMSSPLQILADQTTTSHSWWTPPTSP